MMLSSSAWLALAYALASIPRTRAVSVQFTRVSTSSSSSPDAFFKSGSFSIDDAQKDQDGSDVFGYTNSNNVSGSDIYVATIRLSGKAFEVQLDTGSSDLWIDASDADLSSSTATGLETGLTYGDGTVAQGPIYVDKITLGDFTVDSAFISAPGTNATTNRDKGLLGVGPPLLSAIFQSLSGTPYASFGITLLGNIFAANSSLPQFTTFTLSRSFATGQTDGGVFTIGEIPSNLSAIENATRLDVVSNERWIVLMDGIVVDGRSMSGLSSFEVIGQTVGQTLVNLDTGTSLSQIPQSYAEFIYGSIPGAQFVRSSGIYILPCDTRINLSFVFAGIEYPVHPIDTVSATTDLSGGVVCFSGFTIGDSSSEDFLLGDSFLRNVYSLYDYGAFFNESSTPYIQLLSTTNADQAYADFDTLSRQRNQTLTSDPSNPASGSSSACPSTPTYLGRVALAISALLVGLVVL